MKGKFITFEGIEGCGKSTQIKLLYEHLCSKGYRVSLTREPGGTDIGKKVRQILLDPENVGISPIAELLLYNVDRVQHIEEVIRPAIAGGEVILSDRYSDSTMAYQCAARRLEKSMLEAVDEIATNGLRPDLTILLDLPANKGLARAKDRSVLDRFEREALEFHDRVRRGYLDIATAEPNRVVVVDALKSIDEIHKEIKKTVIKRLEN